MNEKNLIITNHASDRMRGRFYMSSDEKDIKKLILAGRFLNDNEYRIFCLSYQIPNKLKSAKKIEQYNRIYNGILFIIRKDKDKFIVTTIIPWRWIIDRAAENIEV